MVLVNKHNYQERYGNNKFGSSLTLSRTAVKFLFEWLGETRIVVGILCIEPVDSNSSTKLLIVVSEERLLQNF